MVSSTEAFRLIYEKLDAVILGALQVGFDGNVNLSKRGDDAGNYVGPGGAMDLLTKAQLIIFCCGLSTDQKIQIIDGRMVVQSLDGKANFVKQVDEVTFSAQQALAAGKKVFYVTPIGVLKLTPDGLQICALMPDAHENFELLHEVTPDLVTTPDVSELSLAVPKDVATGRNFELMLRRS